MKCPECGSRSKVLLTRSTHRRRECLGEKRHRFSTTELYVVELQRMQRLVYRYNQLIAYIREEFP